MICEVCPFPTRLDALAKTLTRLLSDSKREHTGNMHKPGSWLSSIARQGRSGYDSVVNDLTIALQPSGLGSFLYWFVSGIENTELPLACLPITAPSPSHKCCM